VAECRGVAFLYCAWFLITHKTAYLTRESEIKTTEIPFVYGIIVSMQRFVNFAKGYVGESILHSSERETVSATLIADLEAKLGALKEIFQFEGLKVYRYAPQLLVQCKYDVAVPTRSIRPYPHQAQVVDFLDENFDDGVCVGYVAMTNSGKTCTAAALAKLVQKKRLEDPKYADLQLIFCCNLPAVKDQVAQWTFNIANVADPVPFGIGCMDSRGPRVVNSFNCKSDAERIVIVCSPDVARRLLAADSGAASEKYVVFHDEPTVGADVLGSSSLQQNVETMMCPSKWSIWSSATLPPRDKMTRFIDIARSKFPSVKVEYVYSNKIQIGCDIYTYNGDVVMPHLGCKTQEELTTTIRKIKGNPFLGRPYTPNVVETIWLLMVRHKVRDIPNIGVLFGNVDNLTADTVRETAMSLLEILATQPNAVIETICASPITAHRLSKAAPEAAASTDEVFEWEEEKKPECRVTNRLVFEHLGTTEAHKFLQPTLIASAEPLKFAITNFADLIGHITARVRSVKKLYSDYEKELSAWQAQYDRIEKDIGAAAKQRDRDAPRMGSAEDEISRRQQAMQESKPILSFPKDLQVNTLEHIQRFAKGTNVVINPQFVRAPIVTTKIDPNPDRSKSERQSDTARIDVNKINVPEEVLFLLFAGIGIYAPSCKHLNDGYLAIVLALAKEGKLAFLVCDSTICYGTNYPVNRTITLPDFAALHSTNTLQQYMSRAGRVGQSWIAEAYVDDDTARRLIACCHVETSSDEDREITNMVATLDAIEEASQKRDEELMERIHEEMRLEAEKLAEREAEVERRAKEIERRLALPAQPAAKVERPRVVEISEVLERNKETSHTATSWRRDISRDDVPHRQPAAEAGGLVRRPGAYQPPHLRGAGGAKADQPPQQQEKRTFGSGWGRR
jgi:Skp family chaperone for outer membrane proteins